MFWSILKSFELAKCDEYVRAAVDSEAMPIHCHDGNDGNTTKKCPQVSDIWHLVVSSTNFYLSTFMSNSPKKSKYRGHSKSKWNKLWHRVKHEWYPFLPKALDELLR